MHFQRQDLSSDHYNWNQDEQVFTGQPSRRPFDRYNGYQVLFIINFYGSLCERFSLSEGRKIEEKILDQLPLDVKSEISVFNWIRSTELVNK